MERAAVGAVAACVMEACGGIGDMWVQTSAQARDKGLHGPQRRRGQAACAAHALTYTACQAVGLVVADRALGLGLRPGRVAAWLAVAGGSHYLIDRREPLRRLAEAVGKGEFYRMTTPVWGAFEMDQAAHRALNTLAGFAMASGR